MAAITPLLPDPSPQAARRSVPSSVATAKRGGAGGLVMGRYELGCLLGHGTFSKMYHAWHVQTGESVAIKVLDREKVERRGLVPHIKREIVVLHCVCHSNIVHLFEVMATKTKIYFMMELVRGGELFSRISKGRLKEDTTHHYFQQLASSGAVDGGGSSGGEPGSSGGEAGSGAGGHGSGGIWRGRVRGRWWPPGGPARRGGSGEGRRRRETVGSSPKTVGVTKRSREQRPTRACVRRRWRVAERWPPPGLAPPGVAAEDLS